MGRQVAGQNVELQDGKLWVDGEHRFLKIGKPLRNFGDRAEVDQLIDDLDLIQGKEYNCLEINCYWHHLDRDGDGKVDADIGPLRRLIDEINQRGMFASLAVETYGVGGGQIPAGFWEAYPDALAVGVDGERVADTEYGYMSKVPSLFSDEYRRVSRSYISHMGSLLSDLDLLYFETTVEPQYMGGKQIDYSRAARRAYEDWVEKHGVEKALPFPDRFPVPQAFVCDPVWNRFRAEWLARWINGDIEAFRSGARSDIWAAVDYLDAEEESMMARCGDPTVFLRGLDAVQIVQVNWHWHNGTRTPNQKAYQRVRDVMEATGRDWAVTEHMTLNGTDYLPEEVDGMLVNTLRNGTRFGWEFVDLAADPDGPEVPPGTVIPGRYKPAHFALYDEGWNPKPVMARVDGQWEHWMEQVKRGETDFESLGKQGERDEEVSMGVASGIACAARRA